ncbi:hypothetical protein QUF64_03615 [Anaerolineales bacterium HSG6]|nr:hypothetical protein [Anaerolineales bacterium HSG6]
MTQDRFLGYYHQVFDNGCDVDGLLDDSQVRETEDPNCSTGFVCDVCGVDVIPQFEMVKTKEALNDGND